MDARVVVQDHARVEDALRVEEALHLVEQRVAGSYDPKALKPFVEKNAAFFAN